MNDSLEHLYKCLARHILKRPLQKRRIFLTRFKQRHGEDVTDKLKLYMSHEFNKKRKPALTNTT